MLTTQFLRLSSAKGFHAFSSDGDFKEAVAQLFYDTADSLCLQYEKLGTNINVDVTDDLLSVKSPNGEFLLNRQTPNRQIWLSSPVSGSLKFEFDSARGCWTDTKDPRNEIGACLRREVASALSIK